MTEKKEIKVQQENKALLVQLAWQELKALKDRKYEKTYFEIFRFHFKLLFRALKDLEEKQELLDCQERRENKAYKGSLAIQVLQEIKVTRVHQEQLVLLDQKEKE
jgi:hypothetical protein